ncbi:MAG: NYN domain-containing protein [Gammaproteobacteria bacterium WSBS_2016_MAG_OTU1]
MQETKQLERAIFFVDGSNFYHGMKKLGLKANGLNYSTFSQKLAYDREWVETRFYIGKLTQKADPTLYDGQRRFLSKLENQDKVNIFLGRMELRATKNTANNLSAWLDNLSKSKKSDAVSSRVKRQLWDIAKKKDFVWVEKAVDVNIATDMVSMAYEGRYDVAYLLSADGDFTPAVQKVHDIGKKVVVVSPAYGHKIAQVADVFIRLEKENFHGCWDPEE